MTDHAQARPIRWGRAFLIVFVLLLGAIFVVHWTWTNRARGRLNAQVAAYRAAGEPIEPGDFAVAGVADADNAVLDLRAAHAAIDRQSDAWTKFKDLDPNPALPLRADELVLIGEIVRTRPDVVAHVESAMRKPGVDWQIVWTNPVAMTLLPDLTDQRELAQFLHADALLAHTDGDHARAVGHVGKILFQSRAVAKQPMLVPSLVSVGLSAMASELAMDLAPDLHLADDEPGAATPRQMRELIAQLLDESAIDEAQRNGLLGERMSQLDIARTFWGGPTGAGGTSFIGAVIKPTALDDGTLMIRHTTGVLEAATSSATWPEFERRAPAVPAAIEANRWRHLLASIFMSSLDRAVQTYYRVRVDRRLAAVVLAMRLYASEHDGRLPDTLEALVPAYLPALPLDAMSSSPQPLKYRAGEDPIVYSVGENGVDDQGSEQAASARPSRYPPSRWQMLDSVVHFHRQPRPLPEPAYDYMEDLATKPTTEPSPEPATTPASP